MSIQVHKIEITEDVIGKYVTCWLSARVRMFLEKGKPLEGERELVRH